MKGLTPREYAELRDLAGPDDVSITFHDDETAAVLDGLVEQGRVSFQIEPDADDPAHDWAVWSLTVQGRKAIELYLRIQEAAP